MKGLAVSVRYWIRRCGWLLLGLGLAMPVCGEIYQWVDAAGRVHYSDEAPAGVQSKTVTPNTERLGVQLSTPSDSEAWSQNALNAPATSSSSSNMATTAPGRRQQTAPLNDWETDLCAGVVGDCFSEEQDYVCKLRFGLPCEKIHHWKVCLNQDCNDRKVSDKCDSPYHLLDRRPAVLSRRDMGRPLPLRELVSDRDWQCLSRNGFFCDELADETTCGERYGQTCTELENWVAAAQERCKKQRGSDCQHIDGWKQFRPVSVDESKKGGARLRNGGVASQDYLMETLGVEKDDTERYPQLQTALESLTGLNIHPRRHRYQCDGDWKVFH